MIFFVVTCQRVSTRSRYFSTRRDFLYPLAPHASHAISLAVVRSHSFNPHARKFLTSLDGVSLPPVLSSLISQFAETSHSLCLVPIPLDSSSPRATTRHTKTAWENLGMTARTQSRD